MRNLLLSSKRLKLVGFLIFGFRFLKIRYKTYALTAKKMRIYKGILEIIPFMHIN